MKFCSIEGCGRPHHARSWCAKHYALWRRWGTPEAHFRPESWHAELLEIALEASSISSLLAREVAERVRDMQIGGTIILG